MEINYKICIAGLSGISKKKFFKFIENIYSLRLATYIPRYDRAPMASYGIPETLCKTVDINYIPIGELT